MGLIAGLVPPPGPGRRLALAILVTTVGNGAFVTTSVLYLTRSVGLSPVAVGVGLTVAGVAGLTAGIPFGHLADTLGPRRVTVLLTTATGLCVAGYLVVSTVWSFVLVAIAFSLVDRGAYAARQALTGSLFSGPELVRTRARLRSITNIGIAVGAGLGALVVTVDSRPAYSAALVVDALSFLGCALVLHGLPDRRPRGAGAGDASGLRWYGVLRDRPYVALTCANMVLMLHAPLIEVILPLWIAGHTDVPRAMIAVLVIVNTAGVVLLQVRVSSRIDTLVPAARAVRLAGLLLAASCLLFAGSGAAGGWAAAVVLVVGCVLHVLGEILQASGAWVISYDLAPDGHLGQYQGLFTTGATAAQQLAPAALILLVVEWGEPGWFVLAGVFAVAATVYARLVPLGRERPVTS